jgi:hypothetical protein
VDWLKIGKCPHTGNNPGLKYSLESTKTYNMNKESIISICRIYVKYTDLPPPPPAPLYSILYVV